MDSPKSLEELDKIIESQKQHREIEYERRKWLFAISGFSHLSFGINTFPDLIEKDKDFWKILPVVWLIFVVLIGIPKITSIYLFTLIIVIIHLGNLFFMDKKWALFYTVLSIPMAIIFGNMILQGFVLLTTSIHLLFYLIFNATYWFPVNIKEFK